MRKKLDLGMVTTCVRAARVNLEDGIKSLIGDNSHLDPAPCGLAWINKEIADVYAQLVSIELNLTEHEDNHVEEITESKGVTKPGAEKETCSENEKSDSVAESSDLRAGLGEKSEPVAPAPASEEKTVPPAAEEKATEVKKVSEVVDEDAEKAERTRICGTLFRVLKGQMDGKAARLRTEEVRDAFLGKPTTVDDIMHDQHAAFIAHMQKAIDDAKGEQNA